MEKTSQRRRKGVGSNAVGGQLSRGTSGESLDWEGIQREQKKINGHEETAMRTLLKSQTVFGSMVSSPRKFTTRRAVKCPDQLGRGGLKTKKGPHQTGAQGYVLDVPIAPMMKLLVRRIMRGGGLLGVCLEKSWRGKTRTRASNDKAFLILTKFMPSELVRGTGMNKLTSGDEAA